MGPHGAGAFSIAKQFRVGLEEHRDVGILGAKISESIGGFLQYSFRRD